MRLSPGIAAALIALPVAVAAQDIPPYVPANPVLASRSALYAQPFVSAQPGWGFRWLADYYNAVEVSTSPPPLQRQYILDAELLQADAWITHDISHHLFVLADIPLRGGYNGFLDGFLIWYHHLTGLEVPARDELPRNTFQWGYVLPDTNINRGLPGTFLGDIRSGVGWRVGGFELIGTVTLPTATVSADGWSRRVVGTSVAATAGLLRTSRVMIDGSVSGGYTPTQGRLAWYQREMFGSGFVSARWRFAGRQSVFFGTWYQSSNWRYTGFHALDDPEVTADFGFLLHVNHRWPELQLGMTQDLDPKGPALDVGFSVGMRWGSPGR